MAAPRLVQSRPAPSGHRRRFGGQPDVDVAHHVGGREGGREGASEGGKEAPSTLVPVASRTGGVNHEFMVADRC